MKHSLFFLLFTLLFTACAKENQPQHKTINFWHVYGDEERAGWLNAKARLWENEHPGYKINATFKGSYDDVLKGAILAARSSQVPHIVQAEDAQQAYDAGIFQSFDQISPVNLDDILPAVTERYTIDNKLYSIPFSTSTVLLFWNIDKLKAAGIDAAWQPKTFEDIEWALGQAKAKSVPGATLSAAIKSRFFTDWLAMQGALLYNNDNGRSGRATESYLDSEAVRNILSWQQDMAKKNLLIYGSGIEDTTGAWQNFFNEKAMFWMHTSADLRSALDSIGNNFDVGIGFAPHPQQVPWQGTVAGGSSLWLAKDVARDEAEMALNFVLFITNKENSMDWHEKTGYIPIRLSAYEDLKEEGWFDLHPENLIPLEQLLESKKSYATAGALSGADMLVNDIIRQLQQKIILGADIEQSMAEATAKANSALTEYNKSL